MIFVDTSAWIAIVLADDQYHKSALESFDQLTSSSTPLVTTDFVISETYTYLRYHTANFKNLLKLDTILSEAEADKLLALRWTPPKIFQEARRLFFKYTDQSFSFVDCVSFATIQALKIKKAFTFDKDFVVMRLHVIPPV